jgi:hypothetical protein
MVVADTVAMALPHATPGSSMSLTLGHSQGSSLALDMNSVTHPGYTTDQESHTASISVTRIEDPSREHTCHAKGSVVLGPGCTPTSHQRISTQGAMCHVQDRTPSPVPLAANQIKKNKLAKHRAVCQKSRKRDAALWDVLYSMVPPDFELPSETANNGVQMSNDTRRTKANEMIRIIRYLDYLKDNLRKLQALQQQATTK